jgi:hypothetical protein
MAACPDYDIVGLLSDGGYAELVAVPAGNLVPIPDHIGFVEAAAFPLTFLTAWHMLVTRAHVVEGDVVLVPVVQSSGTDTSSEKSVVMMGPGGDMGGPPPGASGGGSGSSKTGGSGSSNSGSGSKPGN